VPEGGGGVVPEGGGGVCGGGVCGGDGGGGVCGGDGGGSAAAEPGALRARAGPEHDVPLRGARADWRFRDMVVVHARKPPHCTPKSILLL